MGNSLNILLVEDDTLLMMSFSDMLRDLGHTVIEAADAGQALGRLAANDDIDVMITDINLPDMDGRDLVDKARQIVRDLPVIYSSGCDEQKVPDLRTDPLLRYLEKPFGAAEADQALRSLQQNFANV